MKNVINNILENLKNAAFFTNTSYDSDLIKLIIKCFRKSKSNRSKEFEAYAEYYDILIRMQYPDYLLLRKTWLDNNAFLAAPDPTIQDIRLMVYFILFYVFLCFLMYLTLELIKFQRNFRLYSLVNRHVTRVNFFRLSIYEHHKQIIDSGSKFNTLGYQKVLNSLDVFLKTPFYNYKSIDDFSSIINDLLDFKKISCDNFDYEFYKKIFDLIDLFSWIVKKNNEKRFFWFIK